MNRLCTLLLIFITFIVSCNNNGEPSDSLILWYKQPANAWTAALPIGNGRLGAMVFGGIRRDHIQFNEETLWTGAPRDYNRKDAVKYLPGIRRLLFEGKQEGAEALAQKRFMGKKNNEDQYDSLFTEWLKKIRAPANLKAVMPDFDDSHWKKMHVPTPNGFERVVPALEGEDGAFWFRKSFDLPQDWSGKQLVLALGNIRDMDFTYINGHFLGTLKKKGDIREYNIPSDYLNKKNNVIAIQVINPDNKGGLSGYHFGAHGKMAVYPRGADPKEGISLEGQWRYRVQDDSPPAFPHYQASYQPFGDLWLDFPGMDSITHYKRKLNIRNAVSTTTYIHKGIKYSREYFASAPHQAIVIHLSADHKKALHFRASLSTKHHLSKVSKIDDQTLGLDLKLKKGILHAESRLRIKTDEGKVKIDSGRMIVEGATSATLYLVAATSYKTYKEVDGDPAAVCRESLASLSGKSYREVKSGHIRSYQKLFDSFSIDLGHNEKQELPTDERIENFDSDKDPSLVALYVQYARYLLISTSRPGSLPANLQGIWNNEMRPPWGSKYTTNINLEMNYWPAEVLNLAACHEPLFAMMKDLAESGQETAADYYGCPGWVLHHNTDIWLGTAPIDNANHGIWPMGGAWLCHQLWQHFQFTKDTVFLRDTAYPMMRSAAKFFNCFLVKDPETGWLISSPSNSPEHGGLVAGPTMDHQMIRDLFKNCILAGKILGIDQAFGDTLQEKYKEIAPNQIGRFGQLQEWLQDKDDTSDHYRHVSHLWGVFPGTDITWQDSALMKAARQSLLYRGDEGTGWSMAWKINLWDRFKDGNHAYALLKRMLRPAKMPGGKERGGSYHNLFDAHPPFQIDGNFGGAAGVANMLIQSETDTIELLPALPDALSDGSVKGICARGAFVLDIHWKNSELQSVKIFSKKGGKCTLKNGNNKVSFDTEEGKAYHLDGHLKLL